MLRQSVKFLSCVLRPLRHFLNERYKQWTKPDTESLVTGTLMDATRSKRDLIAENAFLRQQLIVLKRQTPRPSLTAQDRGLLVLLASRVRGWKDALLVVKPDTLKKWHREGFRIYWRRKSKGKPRQPRISPEAIALIQQMAIENRTWGAKRIRDELRKLNHRVSKRTVRKYMKQARRDLPPRQSGQTWATFLKNHASELWACDFVQTYDLFFRAIFVFFIIELESRRVVHFGITRSPSDAWIAQQWRNATPFEDGPRFLIRDNDDKLGPHFSLVTGHVDILKTPVRAPKANAVCERFIGSVRRECLAHIIILSERHLRRLVREYVDYFNHARPHQGINRIPDPPDAARNNASPTAQRVFAVPVLGGLHHDYQRAA
jgi:putative transposase